MSRSVTRSKNEITGSSTSVDYRRIEKNPLLTMHVAILLSRSNQLPPRVLENKINRKEACQRDRAAKHYRTSDLIFSIKFFFLSHLRCPALLTQLALKIFMRISSVRTNFQSDAVHRTL